MAVRRRFLVRVPLCRAVSRCSRKALIISMSRTAQSSLAGGVPVRSWTNTSSSLRASRYEATVRGLA